jgi:hypothetical protein
MRSLNAARADKTLSAASFLDDASKSHYDLILMNWVLHHLVRRDIRGTRELIGQAVDRAYEAVRPGGIVVVAENVLRSRLGTHCSSSLLFAVTRSRLLRPVISRMKDGEAIAGIGIYYLSRSALDDLFRRFEPVAEFATGDHDYGWKLKPIGISRVTETILLFRKPALP